MKTKNVGTAERVVRVVLGASLAIWAVMLLFGAENLIWLLAYVAFIALGVDLVVTGIRGYCPLYNLLGWSTPAPRVRA